jgi:predicted Zn-dependent peptidase
MQSIRGINVIVQHTLPNGVRVVAEQIPYVRSVALGLWVGAGSRHESEEDNGISHFIEHMLFKGTRKRTARQLAEAFDEIGGQVNAFTSKEMTCYYAKVLDQHFPIALDILADMFFESTFAEGEIAKEQKVIVEEIRMVEDTPDDLIHDLLSSVALKNHPLGYPILGSERNVRSFDRGRLLSYRDRYYRPDNLVIALAGNLPEDFMSLVESYFASFTNEQTAEVKESPSFSHDVITRQKQTEQTHLCLGLPGVSLADERIYPFILLNNILGGNMSSRLFQEIREERGLAYSVYSYHSAYRDCGLFAVYAGTAHGQEEEVTDLILRILEDVRENGVTESELKKAKEQMKGSMMLGLESTSNRMSRLGKNELLLGRHLTLDEMVARVEDVTLEDVRTIAREIFSQPLSLALISPSGNIPASYGRDRLV